jgi:hypothetical protein
MKRGFGRISSTEIKNNIIEDLQQWVKVWIVFSVSEPDPIVVRVR